MIIHIDGVSGSGKTTLGKRISGLKNVVVYEMDDIDINKILNREKYITEIKDVIKKFESNPDDFQRIGGIYIYGETGIGKTFFVKTLLNNLNYDVINYDAGNIRNTSIIENITKDKFSNKNIYYLMQNKLKKN